MPNHVTNLLTTTGDLEPFISEDSNEREAWELFDFRLLIPPPSLIDCQESTKVFVKTAAELALGLINLDDQTPMPADPMSPLNMATSTRVLHRNTAIRQLATGPHPKDFSDEDFEQFILLLRAHRQSGGHLDWYDWNRANWGTKWNSYSFERRGPGVIKFETAWCAPHPVVEALAARLGVEVTHEWADEDIGSNCGVVVYRPGQAPIVRELSGAREGYELAFELNGLVKQGYRYVCPDYPNDGGYEPDGDSYAYVESPGEVA